MDYRATILLYAELLLALLILWRDGLLGTRRRFAAGVAAVSLAFALRYCCLTYETLDYQDWIRVWIDSLRQTGPWTGLGQEIWSCNYNAPYLYFLALISLSGVKDLLLVKLLSILFDVLLAWAVSRLAGLFVRSPAVRLFAFAGVLWMPTVFLNGAYWGQCDSIYGALAVAGVYFALDDRPCLSLAAIALSISFKLQGIFILPLWLVFVMARKVSWRQLLVFPAVYVVSILPAVLAGRDFWELITLYYRNTGTIGDGLNYNSSSMYALFDFDALPGQTAGAIGIAAAAVFCAAVLLWCFLCRDRLTDRALLGAAVVFCVGVPFFLPHMHDRYFFLADVLSFALAVTAPCMAGLPLLVWFGSFLGYHAYLELRYLLPMRWGALAMLAALLVSAGYTAYAQHASRGDPPAEEYTPELFIPSSDDAGGDAPPPGGPDEADAPDMPAAPFRRLPVFGAKTV